MIRKALLCLLLLLFPAFFLCSEDKIEYVVEKEWKVGFTIFEGNLPREDYSLYGHIPELLRVHIRDLEFHVLTPREKELLKENKLREERNLCYNSIADSAKKKDDLFFEREAKATERRKLERSIRENKKKLEAVINTTVESVWVDDKIPLSITAENTEGSSPGKLLSPSYKAQKEGFDIVILGTIEIISDVYVITIKGFHRWEERTINLVRVKALRDGIPDAIDEIGKELVTFLLGRPWGGLDVTVAPKEAMVYVNGELLGLGGGEAVGLPVNEPIVVETALSGYQDKRETITLKEMEERSIDWLLPPKEVRYTTLETEPPKATVYRGSRYIGKTPLQIEVPDFQEILVIQSPGKETVNYLLRPDVDSTISLTLKDDAALLISERLDKKRKSFYWSLALATASITLPLITSGVRDNYWDLYEKENAIGNYDKAQEAFQSYRLTHYFFLGSLGLAAGGIAFMGWNLYDYITTTDKSANLKMKKESPLETPPEQTPSPTTSTQKINSLLLIQ